LKVNVVALYGSKEERIGKPIPTERLDEVRKRFHQAVRDCFVISERKVDEEKFLESVKETVARRLVHEVGDYYYRILIVKGIEVDKVREFFVPYEFLAKFKEPVFSILLINESKEEMFIAGCYIPSFNEIIDPISGRHWLFKDL